MKLHVTLVLCLILVVSSSSSLGHWPRACGSRLVRFLTEQCPIALFDCPTEDSDDNSIVSMVADCCLKPCSMEVARKLCCTYAKEHTGDAKPVKFTPQDIYMFKDPLPT